MAEKEYIERESAIDAVKKERNYTGKFTFEEEHAWAVGFQQGITFALSDIAVIPAADVHPVVRGKWIVEQTDDLLLEPLGVKDAFRCSSCGYSHINFNQKKHNYCPNCGADMRETENEKT